MRINDMMRMRDLLVDIMDMMLGVMDLMDLIDVLLWVLFCKC